MSLFSNYCSQGITRWKDCRAKKKKRLLESRHLPPKEKWKPELNRNPATLQTWHSLWLQLTGNTDESRICPRKCKWTCSSLFSGPPKCSGWEFGFQCNNLDPSITSTIHPRCQSLSVPHQANARAAAEPASNTEGSLERFLPPLFRGFWCLSNPCLVSIVNCLLKVWEAKGKCAEFVVFLYRVATGATAACLICQERQQLPLTAMRSDQASLSLAGL